MKREHLFLEPGKKNPEAMIKGRARERAKAERTSEATERYLTMLKARKKALEEEKPIDEGKKPRILYANYPVENYQSPIIQQRE